MNQEEMKKAEDILSARLDEKTPPPIEEGKKEEKTPAVVKKDEKGEPTDKDKKIVPEKLIIGGKEYSTEEAAARIKKLEELEIIEKQHGDIRSIFKEFTKRSQELKELKEGKDKKPEETKNEIAKIDKTLKEYNDEEKEIREKAKKNLGLAYTEDVEKALEEIAEAKRDLLKMKEDLKTELTDIKAFKEKKQSEDEEMQIKRTNEDLIVAETTYPFVKRNDVIDYIVAEGKKGNMLSVEEAVKRVYTDEIIDFKVKKQSVNVPETDTSKGGKPEETNEEDKTDSFSKDHDNLFQKGLKAFEESLNKIRN